MSADGRPPIAGEAIKIGSSRTSKQRVTSFLYIRVMSCYAPFFIITTEVTELRYTQQWYHYQGSSVFKSIISTYLLGYLCISLYWFNEYNSIKHNKTQWNLWQIKPITHKVKGRMFMRRPMWCAIIVRLNRSLLLLRKSVGHYFSYSSV